MDADPLTPTSEIPSSAAPKPAETDTDKIKETGNDAFKGAQV